MRLNGWIRLWIVLGALWAIPVALLAYDIRPKIDDIKSSWVYEAANEIAVHISEREGQDLAGYRVRERIREKFPTDDLAIAWLEKVAAKPEPNQTSYSYGVGKVNRKFRERIAGHTDELRAYALRVLLVWLVPLLAVLTLGYAIGWIRRGFRPQRDTGI